LVDAFAKDTIIAIFGAASGLAGLLLIFVGFVYAKGDTVNPKRGDKFRNVARAGIAPFGLALVSAWWSLNYLQGDLSYYHWAVWSFRASVLVTGWYGFIVMFIYL
jgi:hypothetical protein